MSWSVGCSVLAQYPIFKFVARICKLYGDLVSKDTGFIEVFSKMAGDSQPILSPAMQTAVCFSHWRTSYTNGTIIISYVQL
ncbi:hypothetical protein FA95DRAFT_1552991, partial [Auriscalpium vulgare]